MNDTAFSQVSDLQTYIDQIRRIKTILNTDNTNTAALVLLAYEIHAANNEPDLNQSESVTH